MEMALTVRRRAGAPHAARARSPRRATPVRAGHAWADISEHWLAVEILSRSSRVYDREFKRDAYLTLGVREVWLVDVQYRSIEVCMRSGTGRVVHDALTWRAADG